MTREEWQQIYSSLNDLRYGRGGNMQERFEIAEPAMVIIARELLTGQDSGGDGGASSAIQTIAFLTVGDAVANTAETRSLFVGATNIAALLIPANFIPVGAGAVISMIGDASMAASGTPPLTIEITANGTAIGRVEYTTATAMNNRSGRFSLEACVYRSGLTTCSCAGMMRIGADDANQANTQASMVPVGNADFSQQVTLDIRATWGAAHASTSIKNGYCMVMLATPRT